MDGVQITPNGRHVGESSAGANRLLATAHADGLSTELLVSNFSSTTYDFDPAAGAALLRNPDNV